MKTLKRKYASGASEAQSVSRLRVYRFLKIMRNITNKVNLENVLAVAIYLFAFHLLQTFMQGGRYYASIWSVGLK